MTNDDKLVSAKESIELLLAERLAEDPAFLNELTTDPDSVIKPMIAATLEDDGDIDLSQITTIVSVDTPNRLHFSIPVTEADEVSGFGMKMDLGLSLRSSRVVLKPAGKTSALTTISALCVCPSEDCETEVVCDMLKA